MVTAAGAYGRVFCLNTSAPQEKSNPYDTSLTSLWCLHVNEAGFIGGRPGSNSALTIGCSSIWLRQQSSCLCQFRFFTCCPWCDDEHAIKYHLKDESNTKPFINNKNTRATVSSNLYFVVRINTSVSSRLLTASIFGLVSLFSSPCKCRE